MFNFTWDNVLITQPPIFKQISIKPLVYQQAARRVRGCLPSLWHSCPCSSSSSRSPSLFSSWSRSSRCEDKTYEKMCFLLWMSNSQIISRSTRELSFSGWADSWLEAPKVLECSSSCLVSTLMRRWHIVIICDNRITQSLIHEWLCIPLQVDMRTHTYEIPPQEVKTIDQCALWTDNSYLLV